MDTQVTNYTFDKSAKTVTFTDYATIRLDSIRLVINVDTNTVIYNPAKASTGGTVINNVLTLDYDTSAMSNTDKLQIIYNNADLKASQALQTESNTLQQELINLISAIQELTHRLDPLASAMNSGAPALRTIPIASVSTAVTGTLAISAITNMGTFPAYLMGVANGNMTAIKSNIDNVVITN